eukprot:s1110_g8.t1
MLADVLTKLGCERELLLRALADGVWRIAPTEEALERKMNIRAGRQQRKKQQKLLKEQSEDSLHLDDVWTPLEGAKASEGLTRCGLPTHSDLAMEEVRQKQVELRKGCRLLTVQSRERYPVTAAGGSIASTAKTATTAKWTQPTQRAQRRQRTKRRKEVRCDVAEKTGVAKLVVFSGALPLGHTTLTLAGIDSAGWPHDSFSQLDLGAKLALQNPFESVQIETGALLQESEPEELVVLSLSHGGNSAYRLASGIERATGRAVRGVVMWDFISAFGRIMPGPPAAVASAFEKQHDMTSRSGAAHIEVKTRVASASPDFRPWVV